MWMRKTLGSLAVAAAMLSHVAMATTFTVGGPTGSWDAFTDLQTWASSQKYSVGDNLLFQYTPNHVVLEVSKEAYDSCQTSNPIHMYNGGSTVTPLASSGTRYFICGTGGHCSLGMKIVINTLAASTPAPPVSPPPPVTSNPPPPALHPPPASTPPTHASTTATLAPPTAPPPPIPTIPTAAPPPIPTTPTAAPPGTPTPPPFRPTSSPPTETPTYQPAAKGNPISSPSVPATESPANSPSPGAFSPAPPPFSAARLKLESGSATGFGFIAMILLFL